MADEIVKKEDVKVEDTKVSSEEVKVNSHEEIARQEGWRPLEEWNGDPEDWKDAKSFVRDGELFKKIDEVKRENKNLRKTVTTLKTHYEKVRETEYNRALETLKQQKKAALREGDTDLAVDLDDQIDRTREELDAERRASMASQQPEPELHPEFQAWVNRNKWYDNKPEAREFADNMGVAFKKSHPSASPKEVLEYVEDRVARGYPELFKNPKKTAPSAVEGGQGPRKSHDTFAMTDLERQVMNKLVRSKTLTEEQYINDLKELDKQGKR